jgi:hypothetical protein
MAMVEKIAFSCLTLSASIYFTSNYYIQLKTELTYCSKLFAILYPCRRFYNLMMLLFAGISPVE